jgi:hypothetical protein
VGAVVQSPGRFHRGIGLCSNEGHSSIALWWDKQRIVTCLQELAKRRCLIRLKNARDMLGDVAPCSAT